MVSWAQKIALMVAVLRKIKFRGRCFESFFRPLFSFQKWTSEGLLNPIEV